MYDSTFSNKKAMRIGGYTHLRYTFDYLEDFSGTVITISHDRYFLDNVVVTIFAFREGGEIRKFSGGYTDYLGKRDADAGNSVAAALGKAGKNEKNKPTEPPHTERT